MALLDTYVILDSSAEELRNLLAGAFRDLMDSVLKYQHESGELHMDGICLVAGLGGNTNRPGTYDYYMSEPIVQDDAKGVGPYLLAYTEMRRRREAI